MSRSASASVRPRFARYFYPGDEADCLSELHRMKEAVILPPEWPRPLIGGIVPHAGWRYSGLCAAHFWRALADGPEAPEVVVLLGAVHRHGVEKASLYEGDAWETPLGPIEVDRPLSTAIASSGGAALQWSAAAHDDEHSLEVQVPFIKAWLPSCRIVPIQVPPDARAPALSDALSPAIRADARRVALVASSDLTHYGSRYGFAPAGGGEEGLRWARANDDRLVAEALAMRPEAVLEEAKSRHNACGAGAIAACISTCQSLGADESALLHQTTSWDARPEGRGPEVLSVGYAALAFGGGSPAA